MKLKTIVGVLVLAGCSALIANRVVSQDPGDAAPPKMPSAEEMKAMTAKWLAAMSPGKHHKPLEYFVGSWKTNTKMWLGGPGSEPVETKGRSTVK